MLTSIFPSKSKIEITDLIEKTRFTEGQIVEMKTR